MPETAYEQIVEAARVSGRTISEEMVWRVERAFQWEQTFGEFDAWKAKLHENNEKIARGNLEAVLHSQNWKHVAGARFGEPDWISPNNHQYQRDHWVDPAVEAERKQHVARLNQQLEEALDRVVTRAVKAALAEVKS